MFKIRRRKPKIGSGHSHNHRDPKSIRNLKISLFLTAGYMFAEAIGGWLTNSLALLADAGHMLTDVAALTLTLGAFWFASRPATANKSFGYYRLEVLAAFVNGIILVVLSFLVIWEAWKRSTESPEIMGEGLTIVAIGGLLVNMVSAWLLHGNHKHDLNLRGAWLHIMGDLFGSIAAIVAGGLILMFGWIWADAVASVVISLIIVVAALNLIRESVNVLLEGTPRHISLAAVANSIGRLEGVKSVHDLHIWTISSGIEALSVHIVHDDELNRDAILLNVKSLISDEFGIGHTTVQLENAELAREHSCFSGTNCFETVGRQ
ncbi:MAG: cation diffusion facilitator family transporter [Pyrinomonadaceae bacterium]